MTDAPRIALPGKGRMATDLVRLLKRADALLEREGDGRGYRGRLRCRNDVLDVLFLPARAVVTALDDDAADFGITGLDLLAEHARRRRKPILELGISTADVVVAVPEAWLDVRRADHLAEAASLHRAKRGRRLRVATKYPKLAEAFLFDNGVADYRLVESVGATEGAPAADAADFIVDISTSGTTLKANHLKPIDDGLVMKTQAVLVAANTEKQPPKELIKALRKASAA